MQHADSISSILQWQSGLFQNMGMQKPGCSLKNILLFPNQASYVVDCRDGKIVESSRLGQIFGYSSEVPHDIEQLYTPILTQDLSPTLRYTWAVLDWIFKNKEVPAFENTAEFTYRIRLPNGRYRKILRQTTACGKMNGLVTHTLGVLTDISHLDNSNKVFASVGGPNAEFFDPEIPEVLFTNGILSSRECEILKLLARGFSSREIAVQLHVSSHTVDTHRRNMIHKLEVRNSIELINVGKDMGLL